MRLRVWMDNKGGVYAADLLGCVSQGDSEQECLENIVEAFEVTLNSYLDRMDVIPWTPTGDCPEGWKEVFLWINCECKAGRLPVGLREMTLTAEAKAQLDQLLSEPAKTNLTPKNVPEITEQL